jgi:hypothetical protein
MIIHVCSHYGDIEVKPGLTEDDCLIEYMKLTQSERRILREYIVQEGIRHDLGDNGTIVVPLPMWEVGEAMAQKSHGGNKLVTAIRFSDGTVKARKGGFLTWAKERIFGTPEEASPAAPKPEAAVATKLPKRGCPMPTVTDLREAKAASVVRKFLSPKQQEDFDRSRAFVSVGKDTGRLYRLTSRWSPDVERFGVLYDIERRRSICASDLDVPPSEEVLAMTFAVEHFEHDFLHKQPHG